MPQTSALCDGIPVHSPETNSHQGCFVLTKTRHVIIPKGTQVCIEWPMRHANGKGMDLSDCFPEEQSESISLSLSGMTREIHARFAPCDSGTILEVVGEVADASQGTVRFNPPKEIYNLAGIYQMQVGVVDPGEDGADDRLLASDKGLLSVEGSLWGDTNQGTSPPTLNDVRMHLRDTPIENDLLADYEFDSDEVMSALVRPIRQWNETPPPVARFTCATFPYRYYWLQAVVAELLRTAAHWYMRNNLKVQHGGVQGNVKDKYKEYLILAETYRQEWLNFIDQKKVEINAGMAFGTINSAYAPRTF